jgi:hypothetical protein
LELRPSFGQSFLRRVRATAFSGRKSNPPRSNHTFGIIAFDRSKSFFRFSELKRVEQGKTVVETRLDLGLAGGWEVNVPEFCFLGRQS